MNTSDTASPQGSPGRTSDKAQRLARTAGNSQSVAPELVTGKTSRRGDGGMRNRSERRAKKKGVKPVNGPGTVSFQPFDKANT
jgi:hypothetical protein